MVDGCRKLGEVILDPESLHAVCDALDADTRVE